MVYLCLLSVRRIRWELAGIFNNIREYQLVEEQTNEEKVPAMQRMLDNPFLLLFIGVAVPTVLYTMWGIMEVISIPMVK